jgi:hypothetical protein
MFQQIINNDLHVRLEVFIFSLYFFISLQQVCDLTTKPSSMSVAGERSDSWRWALTIGGDTTPPLFEGRWGRYW